MHSLLLLYAEPHGKQGKEDKPELEANFGPEPDLLMIAVLCTRIVVCRARRQARTGGET